ncbi:MAG TPA: acylphosphatase [Gammaproteobacteria bacterium]|nr:acylphosphatase [Gammaproteobacteria bacterium]
MQTCVRCIITGRVQGVFFRASTEREAQRLGVTGYARNLADGSVEVLACGEASALEQLQQWLWKGPPAARVSDVRCESLEVPVPDSFTTRW